MKNKYAKPEFSVFIRKWKIEIIDKIVRKLP